MFPLLQEQLAVVGFVAGLMVYFKKFKGWLKR